MDKLVFINRYFYPDHSATSQLLSDLAFYLAKGSKEIHIITSRQRYDKPEAKLKSKEIINNVHIHRLWTSRFGRGNLFGRAIDYGTFYFSAMIYLLLLVNKTDTLIAKTDPPLISTVAATVSWIKGARLVNWLQDLFPEVATALSIKGMHNGVISYTFKWFRNWSLKSASMNVVLGELMKARLIKEGIAPNHIKVIHNWADSKLIHPVEREKNSLRKEWGLKDKFVVGYSGNLGRAHEFKTILNAAELLKEKENIVFLFIGGGAQYELVNQEAVNRALKSFIFKPYQSREMLSESLSVPDVHLISLRSELEGLIVPSKFYGIAGVGRPVIYIGDKNGEIPMILENEKCGFTINIGEAELLAELIDKLNVEPEMSIRCANRSRGVFEQRLNSERSIKKWEFLLNAD